MNKSVDGNKYRSNQSNSSKNTSHKGKNRTNSFHKGEKPTNINNRMKSSQEANLNLGDSRRAVKSDITYEDLYQLLEIKQVEGRDDYDLTRASKATPKATKVTPKTSKTSPKTSKTITKAPNTSLNTSKTLQDNSKNLSSKNKIENRAGDKNKNLPNHIKKSDNNTNKTTKPNLKDKTSYSSKSNRAGNQSGACSHVKKCGGCQVDNIEYSEHLRDKQKWVESRIDKYCKVEKIIGMDKPYHYRNKVHAVFDHDKKGNPISGYYEEGTHHIIPMDSCAIDDKKSDEIIVSIRGLLKSFKIKTYDEDTGYGLLRHVLIRRGFRSGEIMVVLVLANPILPSKNNFVKALRQLHPDITTIVVNVNDKKTSMILGDKEQIIYGKGYIEDTLCDKVFRISPKSFYQVNPIQTENLYRKAIELAKFSGGETIIDAYCGIGTIGIIASDRVKKVIGVELNKDAVKDANINAKRNQLNNIEFYNNDAGEFMRGMADLKETVDAVFLDPPRAGSDEKFLSSLVQLKPKKVVYISCNPDTLGRDLEYLIKKGYKAQTAIPVDMFPWTGHTEVVVLLQHQEY